MHLFYFWSSLYITASNLIFAIYVACIFSKSVICPLALHMAFFSPYQSFIFMNVCLSFVLWLEDFLFGVKYFPHLRLDTHTHPPLCHSGFSHRSRAIVKKQIRNLLQGFDSSNHGNRLNSLCEVVAIISTVEPEVSRACSQ